MSVRLIAKTMPVEDEFPEDTVKSAQDLVAYCARVSNPSNQANVLTYPKLLMYLINHRHWSPFEMVSLVFEIKTTRSIAPQILRHRSFSFQEFSQRYSVALGLKMPEIRMKTEKNRQSSTDVTNEFDDDISQAMKLVRGLYDKMVSSGVATETAREILPLCTETTLYMQGTLRSFIHYVEVRSKDETQKEHRVIALQIRDILKQEFPALGDSLWK
mgnify:FL=1